MQPTPFTPDPSRDPAGVPRVPPREEVRSAVAAQQRALLAAAKRGENPQHLALDNTDRLHAAAAALEAAHGPAAAAAFLTMWTEEVTASNAALEQETAAVLEQQAREGGAAQIVGAVLALLVLAAVLWMIVN